MVGTFFKRKTGLSFHALIYQQHLICSIILAYNDVYSPLVDSISVIF